MTLVKKSYIPNLGDLLNVGYAKPVGYLPIISLDKHFPNWKTTLIPELISRKLGIMIFPAGYTWVMNGPLVAFSWAGVESHIRRHRQTIDKSNWPHTPMEFVTTLFRILVKQKENPELYKVIGLAYADKRFTT